MVSHCACPTRLFLPLPHYFRGVAKVVFDCARRTSTFRSCAFRDQGRHLAASSHTLPKLISPPPSSFPMLLDIRLQMPRSCLPVLRRVADAAGEEDELVSSVRERTKSLMLP